MRRGAARGQAVVEVALGLLLFVTVLLFGLYFAEVGVLSLKVEEATSTALWETTARPMHQLPGSFAPGLQAIAQAGPTATARYADLDGRTSTQSGTAVRNSVTEARNLRVECAVNARAERAGSVAVLNAGWLDGIYDLRHQGGMICAGQADLVALRLPARFAERSGRGFFQEPHASTSPIRVCGGSNRAFGGSCQGRYGLLLDDWGFTGPGETQSCGLGSCANTTYRGVIEKLYRAHGMAQGGAASGLAALVVGSSPYDENTFHMSFRGEEDAFLETELPGGEGMRPFPTSPGLLTAPAINAAGGELEYHQSYLQRAPCFLGRGC